MSSNDERVQLSVLVVDDEYGFGEMLRDVLADAGYDVSLTINGHRAFLQLKDRTVDILLTDVMMPIMDGVALARALRSDPRHRAMRIVLMTSLLSTVRADEGCCDAVLEKPFTPEHLLKILTAVRSSPSGP
jgi:CheY-like chemotaxis protein